MTFSAQTATRHHGPNSNTGQKGQLAAPVIDWCSVTFPAHTLKNLGLSSYHDLLEYVFGTKGRIALGVIEEKRWNFFPWSGVMVDETGTLCGRIGLADNGETHISLTGQGCKHVASWAQARRAIEEAKGRITRADIAVDDFAGSRINVETFIEYVKADAFTSRGRPPLCQLVDDFDSGKGKTLYIGQRGYKQLCVYEKGKQLGDPDSDYCRAELRLYNKHHVIDPAVLTDPGMFFAGAYEVLAQFIADEVAKLEAKERQARPTAEATLENLKRQSGTTIGLLVRAFGEDVVRVIVDHVARPGVPGRFRSYTGDPVELLRTHIQRKDPPDGGS